MKDSIYNILYDYSVDMDILYNSFSNSLALVEKKLVAKIKEPNSLSKEETDLLFEGGFLVEDSVDELAIVRCRTLASKYNTDVLGLTIAPTMDCNFECAYCFERDNRSTVEMNYDVQKRFWSILGSRLVQFQHYLYVGLAENHCWQWTLLKECG